MIWEILKFVGLYLIVVIFHEIGHTIGIKIFTKKFPKINIGKKTTINLKPSIRLKEQEYKTVLFLGILIGVLPIAFYGAFNILSSFGLTIMLILYIFGSLNDIKNFYQTHKNVV